MSKLSRKYIVDNITRLPNFINGSLMRCNLFPERLYGKRYYHHKKFIHDNSTFFDQTKLLLSSVNQAISSTDYYKKLYRNHKIESISDFQKTFNFIDKDVILQNYNDFVNNKINLDDYDMGTTGGTSGRPLKLIAPRSRYAVELSTMHTLWKKAGYDFSARAVIRNHRLKKQSFQINPLTKEVIFDGFCLNNSYFEFIYKTIKRLGVKFIHCYPSIAYEFSVFMRDNHLDTSFIKAFLSGSENIFDYQVELIQNQLGIRFYNWYGHSEKLVLAGYCESTNNYHIEPTYGYFELISEDGKVISEPGEVGEIVGTSFYNPGMPFLRYRTGDYAEYVGDYCPECDRHVPIIKNIRGRWSGDKIYNFDGTFVTTTALNLHDELYGVINGLQYVQDKKGELTILIIKSPQFSIKHEEKLHNHFRSKLSDDTTIHIKFVENLLRKPNGKFVHIMSTVNN